MSVDGRTWMETDGSRGAQMLPPEGEPLPFLSRWSRLKRGDAVVAPVEATLHETPEPGLDNGSNMAPVGADASQVVVDEPQPPAERIDPRTGKPISELTDEDMPDLETLDQDSDLSVFMAGKVSQALRMKALTKVFHSTKFNQVCLCAEYADDYTNFLPLGDIVPHDLKQAIVREGGKLLQRFAERGLQITPEEAEARAAAEFRGEAMPEPDWEQIAIEAEQARAQALAEAQDPVDEVDGGSLVQETDAAHADRPGHFGGHQDTALGGGQHFDRVPLSSSPARKHPLTPQQPPQPVLRTTTERT